MKDGLKLELQGWGCSLTAALYGILLFWVMSLANCGEPSPPPMSYLGQEFVRITSEFGNYDHSVADDFKFLRRNERWLVDEYKITSRETLSDLYRVLALREAVWQLRALTGDVRVPGPSGNVYEVMAALDSAQAHGSFLHEIVGVSHLGADRIADALEAQAATFPETRQMLAQYIEAIRTVRWVDNLGPPGRTEVSGK